MLYLVGLGLSDATDITVKGLEIVRSASRVYLEAYTSILCVGKEELVINDHHSSVYVEHVIKRFGGVCLCPSVGEVLWT